MTADRLARAYAAFDAANAHDPVSVPGDDGAPVPREWINARRVSTWLERMYPQAGEALRLAARAHHLRRWEHPRSGYPMTREGYLRWRAELKRFHAEQAGAVLAQLGFDADTLARTQALIRRERLKQDAEAQALEDAICLAFLQYDFDAFGPQHDEAKVIGIVRKTWAKMSPVGQAAAAALPLSPYAQGIVARALGG